MAKVEEDAQTIDAASLPPRRATDSLGPELKVLAGRYELLGLLGEGGMGSVYCARDRELGEMVALKMLRRDLVAVPEMLERFRQEVKLARKVTSPNVARTFDIGEHEGERFLTMELVDGESLGTLIAREGALAQARAVAIVSAVLAGLGSAHEAGVIHRDLKPDNVLVGRDGSVKVTDFGIAMALASDVRITRGVTGTPAYMAPEQVSAEPHIDARADIYAFGAMLYETLTGELPWQGNTALAMASARLLAPPPDPRVIRADIRPALATLVMRCMATSRDERPRSAAEVGSALAAAASPASMTPPPSPAPAAAPRSVGKAVAVLPFANGGAADDDYLADGLTDDLIDGLSMSPGLRVQSRRAVMAYKGVSRDPRDIGRELGVQVFVEGTLRRVGDRLRVTVRLVSVRDGFQIWAKRFDRFPAEILGAADEATAAIGAALSVEPLDARHTSLADPLAVDLYLRARHAYQTFGLTGVTRALSLFEQALARTPDDAMILSAYAVALLRALSLGGPADTFGAAERAAERAAELGPHLSEAHLALASARYHAGRHPEAGRHALRALELAPSSAEARSFLGRLLTEVGETTSGLAYLRTAHELDPHNFPVRLARIRTHALLGDVERARELFVAGQSDDAPYVYWVMALRFFGHWRGDLEIASTLGERLTKTALRDDPRLHDAVHISEPDAYLAIVEATLGMTGNTKSNLAFSAQLRTEYYGMAGDDEAAFEHLLRADDNGLMDILWIDRCPVLSGLRMDPRFAAVRARVQGRSDAVIAALART